VVSGFDHLLRPKLSRYDDLISLAMATCDACKNNSMPANVLFNPAVPGGEFFLESRAWNDRNIKRFNQIVKTFLRNK
jgi:hypothetical protein